MNARLGFSLIELLVVMLILASVASLISPAINRIKNTFEFELELQTVKALIKKVSSLSFEQGRTYMVTFDGGKVVIEPQDTANERLWVTAVNQSVQQTADPVSEQKQQQKQQLVFTTLRFPKQVITVSREGIPSSTVIRITRADNRRPYEILWEHLFMLKKSG